MAQLSPIYTTVEDICINALKEAGALGIGQSPTGEDITDAWARLQWMLQQWQVQRWLVWHLVTQVVVSTGQVIPYTIGPGGQFNTGEVGFASRPNRLESVFFRQLQGGVNGPVDYPLKMLSSFEDYNRIALKKLSTFSLSAYYDPSYGPSGLGSLYVYPWPLGAIYAIGITVRDVLPSAFPSLTSKMVLPPEYFAAIISNLALALRPKYGLGTFPGDLLPGQAKSTLRVLTAGNSAISDLAMPAEITRNGIYNIYSDQIY